MILCAGEFEIEADAFELHRDGKVVPVEPLVFNLIRHLAENHDRLVTCDELIDAIWQGRAVTDWAVSAAIRAARRALGDAGEPRRFIRTVHGRGLRFVTAVKTLDVADGQPTALAVLPFRNLGGDRDQDYFADGVSEDLMIDLGRVPGLRVAPRFSSFRFRDSHLDAGEIAGRWMPSIC